MNKIYIVFLVSFISLASFGQSLQRVVFNSTGGYIGDAGSIQMLLSVGEPVIGMSDAADASLAQGFLGGSKTVAAVPSAIIETTSDYATVYPNPFTTTIYLKSDIENIRVTIYSVMGQEVYNGAYLNTGIDLSNLSPGIYMMHATANDQIISNTKLLKQ